MSRVPIPSANYQWDPKADWGPSTFDVTHSFKLWGIYTPNFFHENNWKQKIFGGWSISGIFNWHSGFPWSPVYNSGTCDLIYQGGNCQNGSQGQLLPVSYLGGAGSSYGNSTFLSNGGNFPKGGATYFTAPTVHSMHCAFPTDLHDSPDATGSWPQFLARSALSRRRRDPQQGLRTTQDAGVGRKRAIRISR